eukprot:CAMPEP_0206259898 /NCGR_PEP_ID=MMETSP0047_2-20121206/26762_1 /ASSEMBLY_ACC=CAM_ASM_000192 /TAXON_ID=195065 /ORGANISM="Chroomonas mesostigmatica_cf, Strain CCMP1168" /LENGTH=121 /DNA_ID=CAMNT_0053686867 /DNA_START=90 /DNA_END=452 /DNA_ORIENTATION=+
MRPTLLLSLTLLLTVLAVGGLSAYSPSSVAPAPQPSCPQRTAMHLRGGSSFSKWFADANEDLLDEDGAKPAAAAPEEKGEEEEEKRCAVLRRAECKARKDCIYDTALGCYSIAPKAAPAPA